MDHSTNRTTDLPIPNGWFAVAWSKDFVPGDVQRARYFGEELVLFRTRDGHMRALNAYCPHLGAHLAEGGIVVGENVQCPFHGWQYDGDGVCRKIPYCERIPSKARVRAWNVCERNKMVFVWHHAEGAPPSWEVPALPELEDPEWTEPRYFRMQIPAHLQDSHENNCDPVHFFYVHAMTDVPPSTITYLDEGRIMRAVSTYEKETTMGTFEAELERDSWGLGLTSVRTKGIPGAGLLMFSSTSPVDSKHSDSRWVFTVTKNLVDIAGEEFIQNLMSGVTADIRIWENKIHRAAPVLCEADEFLAEYRKWVRQFYSNPVPEAQGA